MSHPRATDTQLNDATRTNDGVPGLFESLDYASRQTLTSLEKAYAGGDTVFSDAKVNQKENCLEFKGMNYDAFQIALSPKNTGNDLQIGAPKDTQKDSKNPDDFIRFLDEVA